MTTTTPATTPTAPDSGVRVRFCPSPTGVPHVGLIRTALFNWAYARRHGGTVVFRIEDTDAARDTTESYEQILEALRWLGLEWDEGVDVGGPHAPYRQSERGEQHREVLQRLIDKGFVYESFSTPDEVEARHKAAGRDPKLGYDNFDRDLTPDQVAAYRAEGRKGVWRLRMPAEDIAFHDLVRGDVRFAAGTVPDFAIARGDGSLLYTFVNPVDDALMGITHVIRGEDLLSSTPRQIALYQALIAVGVATRVPQFAHLPLVTGEGNKKLSKRDPRSNLFHHRDAGFIPEGLLNYLALLGWSIAPDRDIFSFAEMCAHFDVADVSSNPARFDDVKATAINADHLRLLDTHDFARRVEPYLQSAGVLGADISDADRQIVNAVAPLIQTRVQTLSEAAHMVDFLFRSEHDFVVDPGLVGSLRPEAAEVLDASHAALASLDKWETPAIEAALREALVTGLGIKPRHAFGPVRLAISGQRISPPLFESMEILGRPESLRRIAHLRELLAASSEASPA